MKGLLFLCRVAFLCNVLFLICLLLQRTSIIQLAGELKSTVVILGWVMAPVTSLAATVWGGIRLLQKKVLGVPVWLATLNAIFLVGELILVTGK